MCGGEAASGSILSRSERKSLLVGTGMTAPFGVVWRGCRERGFACIGSRLVAIAPPAIRPLSMGRQSVPTNGARCLGLDHMSPPLNYLMMPLASSERLVTVRVDCRDGDLGIG